MSLDAYKRNVGGAITIAVTGTDNPVPSQITRTTPPESAAAVPAIPAEPERPAQDDTERSGKSRKKKKA